MISIYKVKIYKPLHHSTTRITINNRIIGIKDHFFSIDQMPEMSKLQCLNLMPPHHARVRSMFFRNLQPSEFTDFFFNEFSLNENTLFEKPRGIFPINTNGSKHFFSLFTVLSVQLFW